MPSRVPFSPSPRRRRLSRGRSFKRERNSSRSPTEHELRPWPSRRAQLLRGRRYYSHRHGDGSTLTRGSLGAPASTWELGCQCDLESQFRVDARARQLACRCHVTGTHGRGSMQSSFRRESAGARGPTRATQWHPEARCQYLWPHTGLGQARKPPARRIGTPIPGRIGNRGFPVSRRRPNRESGIPSPIPGKKNSGIGGIRFPIPVSPAGSCRQARLQMGPY
jgi:hypothetical protein